MDLRREKILAPGTELDINVATGEIGHADEFLPTDIKDQTLTELDPSQSGRFRALIRQTIEGDLLGDDELAALGMSIVDEEALSAIDH